MSHRLQVLLDEAEFRDIRRLAKRHRTTVAEWVRRALRAARLRESEVDPKKKLSALRAATRHDFPTADMPEMLAEIERGYVSGR